MADKGILPTTAMASDLDTVRVLRALFHDFPRAPQGLSPLETMEWIRRSMTDYEGGEMAYTIEHITRSAMLDIVLYMRETGSLREDAAFEQVLQEVSTSEGRQAFRDRCISAQKGVNETERLLRRAQGPWVEPGPFFDTPATAIDAFVLGRATGAGPLFAEFADRPEVQEIGVFDTPPLAVHEFGWGFLTEVAGGWNVYVAEVWRQGTVGYFERFMHAWESGVHDAPTPLSADDGIGCFGALSLRAPDLREPDVRRWVGEWFIARHLPLMVGRALDERYAFPKHWHPA